ncbi:MAG: hypothetical protein NC110_08095 [Ruminococcus sp.]|nr:hypothetical protein [Ruminococcus sp.]
MKFKNTVTGNIVSTENKATIALMKASDRYVEVTGKGKSGNKNAANAGDAGNTGDNGNK